MRPSAAALLAIVLLAIAPVAASAQRTGGSFGGGSFGRRSSSSSSHGWSSSGSSRSSGSFSSGSSSRSEHHSLSRPHETSTSSSSRSHRPWTRRPRNPLAKVRSAPPTDPEAQSYLSERYASRSISTRNGLIGGSIVFLLALGIGAFAVRSAGPQVAASPSRILLRRVSLGFDWSARAELQDALATLARDGNADDPRERLVLVRAAAALLASHGDAVRFAAFDGRSVSDAEAEGAFHTLALDLRSRFTVDTVRNQTRGPELALRARAEEGRGFVVITLLTASAVELPPLPGVDRDGVSAALAAAVPDRADDLVAFEVIWSPAEENDRMSSAELVTLYPELAPLDEESARTLGRRTCAHCRGPYPAELPECPHCGAATA